MTYLSGRSKTRRKYLNIVLGFVAFSLFVYFWPAFKSAAYPLVEPLVRGYGGTKGLVSIMPEFVVTYVSSHKALSDRARALEIDIEHLENALASKDAAYRELLLVSGVQASSASPVLVLYPIAQDITKLYSTILLSKGYRDGVENGALIYIRGQQPVCEIVEVYDRTSLCELLSKGSRTTEGVTASSSVTLTLSGEGGGSFIAEVPNDTPIQVGEQVLLRSNQALSLGTIIAVQEDDQATGSKVYVRGTYNPVTSSVFYMNVRYAP